MQETIIIHNLYYIVESRLGFLQCSWTPNLRPLYRQGFARKALQSPQTPLQTSSKGLLLELRPKPFQRPPSAPEFRSCLSASWCILVHLGASWCILVHLGASWCILVHLGAWVIDVTWPITWPASSDDFGQGDPTWDTVFLSMVCPWCYHAVLTACPAFSILWALSYYGFIMYAVLYASRFSGQFEFWQLLY